ncbi:MAG: TatD family hydrolase [Desulfarculaceae bacterium]|nr:TatD family hydrolase [Desulfarculaceae bacterium]
MRLFDSHAHIDDKCYEKDFTRMLERAEDHSVKGIMAVGIDIGTSRRAINFAETHDHVLASVGVHPHDATNCSDETIEELVRMAQTHSRVRAWGETGLDFNRMYAPVEDQEMCFEKQLHAAQRLDLPMIFHERDSNGRLLEILRSGNAVERKAVVHCFSGTREEMYAYLDMGFFIGITGILTIKKRGVYLRELAVDIPEDRILIETDAPYLTPAPQKNKHRRNEPAFVRSVLLKLAEIRGRDPEELSETIWQNTERLFGKL